MKVQVENLALQELIDIYYYNYQFSLKCAIKTNENILRHIHILEVSPYIGRYIPEMSDRRFREIIYRKIDILDIELCIIYQKNVIQFMYLTS